MNPTVRTVASGLIAATLFAATGCGGKGEETSAATVGGGSLKTGPGVSDTTITLGVLTDLSGPFAPFGQPLTKAHQLFWDEQNAKGGVCDRKVEMIVKDHGYDPQKAVVQYRDMGPKIAAMHDLLGSPITAALLPTLKADRMPSMLTSWASALLDNDFVIEVGAPYEVEMINGLDYLRSEGKIKSGDKIGHVYFEGEYGEAGLAGTKYFAAKHGMEVVEQKIQPTDEDMSGQIVALKRAGVSAIAVTTSPKQLASLAGIAASQGMNVPILGQNPAFDPALMASPAAKALVANVIVASPVAPFGSSDSAVAAVAKAFLSDHGNKDAKAPALVGYAESQVMFEILKKACENNDLSREGIINAARELSNVDTDGIVAGTLDYSNVGEPPTRASYLARPAHVTGGLEPIGEAFESDTARTWTVAAAS